MPSARPARWVLRAGCALGLALPLALAAACSSSGAANEAGRGDLTAATIGAGVDGGAMAAGATVGPQVPATVPVLATAIDLAVTSDGSYIAYRAPETYAAAVAFYQTGLEAAGWEKINMNDGALGGATMLLRARPEATLTVTIQGVPGDDNAVRVLISYTEK